MIPIGFYPPEKDVNGRWHVGCVFHLMDEPLEVHVVAPHALVAKAWVKAQAALSRRLAPSGGYPPPMPRPTAPPPYEPALGPGWGALDEDVLLDHEDELLDVYAGPAWDLDEDLDDLGEGWLGAYSGGYGSDWLGEGGLGGGVGGLADELDHLSRRRRGHRPDDLHF